MSRHWLWGCGDLYCEILRQDGVLDTGESLIDGRLPWVRDGIWKSMEQNGRMHTLPNTRCHDALLYPVNSSEVRET